MTTEIWAIHLFKTNREKKLIDNRNKLSRISFLSNKITPTADSKLNYTEKKRKNPLQSNTHHPLFSQTQRHLLIQYFQPDFHSSGKLKKKFKKFKFVVSLGLAPQTSKHPQPFFSDMIASTRKSPLAAWKNRIKPSLRARQMYHECISVTWTRHLASIIIGLFQTKPIRINQPTKLHKSYEKTEEDGRRSRTHIFSCRSFRSIDSMASVKA